MLQNDHLESSAEVTEFQIPSLEGSPTYEVREPLNTSQNTKYNFFGDTSKQYEIHNIEEDVNEAQETTYGNDHMLSPINLNSYLNKHKKNIGSIGSNNGMIFTLGNADQEENIEEEKQRKSGVNQPIQSNYIRGK